MSLISFLILLIVAGICGAIGQSLAGFSRGGCLTSIIVGFIGAMLGGWVSYILGMHDIFVTNIGGESFPILWSIIGSALFVGILHLLRRS